MMMKRLLTLKSRLRGTPFLMSRNSIEREVDAGYILILPMMTTDVDVDGGLHRLITGMSFTSYKKHEECHIPRVKEEAGGINNRQYYV